MTRFCKGQIFTKFRLKVLPHRADTYSMMGIDQIAKAHPLIEWAPREGEHVITLGGLIRTPIELRGQGLATNALRDLIAYADRVGKPVALSPSQDFGASRSRLERWYRSLGFKPNRGRAKVWETMHTFIRHPR